MFLSLLLIIMISYVYLYAGTTTSSCDVKLECHFNDLNPAHPVLLVKLLDITLPSSKLLSSGESVQVTVCTI